MNELESEVFALSKSSWALHLNSKRYLKSLKIWILVFDVFKPETKLKPQQEDIKVVFIMEIYIVHGQACVNPQETKMLVITNR